ncbi:MAG TPA: Rieske 2Fe-2S domain-containing protein [Longimicrobiaceae bacterium]|nr:Rieske 2Fe-2S domain-containing protein [Longimicrobiaceae bacterium]
MSFTETVPVAQDPVDEAGVPKLQVGSSKVREFDVAAVAAVPDGEVCGVEVNGRTIALCRLGDEVFALSGTCSYHPIPLDGATLEGEVLTCQWYGAQFDIRTGESVFLRSVTALATYPTSVRDGRVFVRLPVEPARSASNSWVGAER